MKSNKKEEPKRTELHQALMNSQKLTFEEAHELFKEMQERVYVYLEDPEEVLFDEGLEPDYVFDLLY